MDPIITFLRAGDTPVGVLERRERNNPEGGYADLVVLQLPDDWYTQAELRSFAAQLIAAADDLRDNPAQV
jgi:hypothetical protein